MTAVVDAWMETALVAITPIGGSALQFGALTETIDISQGDKSIEGIPLINGGRVTKWLPEEDTEVTLEMYPLQAGTASGTSGLGISDIMNTVDGSEPISVTNDRNRIRQRLTILWTEDTTVTDAEAVTVNTLAAFRVALAEGFITSIKESFTDGILKVTVTYKVTAFDKTGSGNFRRDSQSGDGSTQLPVLASYTTSVKFV